MQPQGASEKAKISTQRLSESEKFVDLQRDFISAQDFRQLLGQGADPFNRKIIPSLVIALALDNNEKVKKLLEEGASVDEAFKSIASGSSYYFAEVLKELVKREANINQIVRDEMTALMFSTTRNMGRTEELLELGADPNIVDKDGNTALHLACQHRKGFSVLSLVTRKRTDRTLRNKAGQTAFDIAQGSDHIIRLFNRTADKDY
jgi:ankyrin repeat protein